MNNASNFIKTIEDRQGLKIACIEEIAFNQGYIGRTQLLELAKPLDNIIFINSIFNILDISCIYEIKFQSMIT